MQLPGFESRVFDDYSLVVSRETLERRLQKLLEAREKSAEHAVLYIELDGHVDSDPDSETSMEKAFLGMLQKDVVWASSADDCIARIRPTELAMIMTICSLSHALQTARLLRLWFRIRIAPQKESENLPDLHIGIARVVAGRDPRQMAAYARNTCESAKRRGRGDIPVMVRRPCRILGWRV